MIGCKAHHRQCAYQHRTGVPVNHYRGIPLYGYDFHHYTGVPVYQYNGKPVYQYDGIPVHHYTGTKRQEKSTPRIVCFHDHCAGRALFAVRGRINADRRSK